jgi:hypothetical protein
MNAKRSANALAVVLALAASIWLTLVSTAAPALQSRTSDADGVSVSVQPLPFTPNATVWEFEVAMNTHTKPLDADLSRAAVLVDENGRRYSPLAWKGDPPGGHHRKGVLQFAAPSEKPKTIELQIDAIGAKRSFKWQLD